jgi:hypothetical protein
VREFGQQAGACATVGREDRLGKAYACHSTEALYLALVSVQSETRAQTLIDEFGSPFTESREEAM